MKDRSPDISDYRRYMNFTLLASGIAYLVILPVALVVAWLVFA